MVCELKSTQNEFEKLNLEHPADENIEKCKNEIKKKLMKLAEEKSLLLKKLHKKREKSDKSASRKFLRQQVNQMRHKRDFNDFVNVHGIDNIQELDSESVSDLDELAEQDGVLKRESIKLADFNVFQSKPKVEINDIFKIVLEKPIHCPKSRYDMAQKESYNEVIQVAESCRCSSDEDTFKNKVLFHREFDQNGMYKRRSIKVKLIEHYQT